MDEITWYPVGIFRRPSRGGLWMTYSGSGKVTFSTALGYELEVRRIRFGEKVGKLCFQFETSPNSGILVQNRQATDGILRRHCKDLEPGTRVHFDFDPDQAIFIESRRERIGSAGDASATIGATRQIAELQP